MLFYSDAMTSTTSNVSFGNAYSSVQANNIHGPIHIGLENTLGRLPRAEDAPFNSYAKQHEPTCLPDTRVDLLREIYSWADGQDERCIFWLSGLAGTGKSTIARTVACSYHSKQRHGRQHLVASFFFSRGGGDVGHARKFVTSIAVQLAHSVPTLRQYICDAVTERGDIAQQSLRDQWQHLVCHPLSKLREPGPYVLVVDALDECDSNDDIQIIVQLLAEARLLTGVRLRVFLTSRPEVPIRHRFRQIPKEHQDFVLHNISPPIVDRDIATFLEHSLRLIAQDYDQTADWPGAAVIRRLVQSASGLFIWAATACRFIREGAYVDDRLDALVQGGARGDSDGPEGQLNRIYTTVLQACLHPNFSARETEKFCSMLRVTLGSVALLASPLAVGCLGNLLVITEQRLAQTLRSLHAILDIPTNPSQPLRLHHPSFRDFLLSRDRCDDNRFWVDERSTHEKLASCCLELMSAPSGLRQNMCSLLEPGPLRSEIKKGRVASSLPPELQYACRYWVEHFERSQQSIADRDAVHLFLQKHLLHWLEAMSLIGETGQCVRLLARLQALVSSPGSGCADFIRDASRFVFRFCSTIADAPLQVYSSALIFAPERSIVQKTFFDQVPQEVQMVSERDADWDACRSVLEGHTGWVTAVVFSPDGQLVASASRDETVRVWETATGTCRSVLESPPQYISCLAFSPHGRVLRSDRGDILLPPNLYTMSPLKREEQPSQLLVQDQWVLRHTQRFLWLPFEYRAEETAVYKDMVCLMCPSGRVALLRLQ